MVFQMKMGREEFDEADTFSSLVARAGGADTLVHGGRSDLRISAQSLRSPGFTPRLNFFSPIGVGLNGPGRSTLLVAEILSSIPIAQ